MDFHALEIQLHTLKPEVDTSFGKDPKQIGQQLFCV
jgi:hypothetical protein